MKEQKPMTSTNTDHRIAWHATSVADVMKRVDADERGLPAEEAAQRREAYGANRLPSKESDAWYVILAHQFISPLMLLLGAATVVSFLLGELVDAGVIGAALGVNALIGFVQEFKVSRTLAHLQSLVHPKVTVLRNGEELEIPSPQVVPGDIVVLEAGDRVVADARLIEVVDMEANEAPLTGESLPVSKRVNPVGEEAALAERESMVYAGTSVVAGRGKAVVVETGLRTELGQIAQLVHETEDKDTPLQAELKRLARWITLVAIVVIVLLTGIGLFAGQDLFTMFETSVAVAVSAVPEGLAVTVTIILAIGMQRILRRKALVRKLVATETLGSVSVICADKTGTITEGEMRLSEVVLADGRTADMADVESDDALNRLLRAGVLCNDAVINREEEAQRVVGTPTERALVEGALTAGMDVKKVRADHSRIDEVPFSSEWKYMATLNETPDGDRMIFLKGAPEKILAFASQIENADGKRSIDEDNRKALEETATEMAKRGLRVLGVAYKAVDADLGEIDRDTDLEEVVFVGFVGIRDPLRAAARDQIADAEKAGIHTVIVTGDHPNTAQSIAREAGLVNHGGRLVTGPEMDDWSDAKLRNNIRDIAIFARVEPRHKIRIVRAWKAQGEVVAMTGDGVNDAPALKAADIGVAVGAGTEVAKQASDMVLIDNNLGTITASIEQGRVIFDNIRKTVVYLLADSFTELVLIGVALLVQLPLPILAVQILWVNLIADSFPAISFSMEPGEPDTMTRPPRARGEPVLNSEMLTIIFIIGIITDIGIFGLFWWYLQNTGDIQLARTIVFGAIGIDSLFYAFAVKSFRRNIFRINPFSNMWLVGGVLVGFGLMFLALLHPFFQHIFDVSPLALRDWAVLFVIGMIKLISIEFTKEIFLLQQRRKHA